MIALICFPNTGFFLADRATTTRTANVGVDYEGQFASGDGVVIHNQTRGLRMVWFGVELAGADTEDFNMIIEGLYGWLTGDTPVEQTSWTAIKAAHRLVRALGAPRKHELGPVRRN